MAQAKEEQKMAWTDPQVVELEMTNTESGPTTIPSVEGSPPWTGTSYAVS